MQQAAIYNKVKSGMAFWERLHSTGSERSLVGAVRAVGGCSVNPFRRGGEVGRNALNGSFAGSGENGGKLVDVSEWV